MPLRSQASAGKTRGYQHFFSSFPWHEQVHVLVHALTIDDVSLLNFPEELSFVNAMEQLCISGAMQGRSPPKSALAASPLIFVKIQVVKINIVSCTVEQSAHQVGAGDIIADLGLSHLLHLPDDVWDRFDAVFDGSRNVPGILCLGIPVHCSICAFKMSCQIKLCHPAQGLASGHSCQAVLGGPCLGFDD